MARATIVRPTATATSGTTSPTGSAPPQSVGAAAILARYDSIGGRSSWLGLATSGYVCGLTRGGCYQHFQGGSIYWSPGSGAHSVRGEIRWSWWAQGWEAGPIGYPTTEEICGLVNGGCVQVFEGGSL